MQENIQDYKTAFARMPLSGYQLSIFDKQNLTANQVILQNEQKNNNYNTYQMILKAHPPLPKSYVLAYRIKQYYKNKKGYIEGELFFKENLKKYFPKSKILYFS